MTLYFIVIMFMHNGDVSTVELPVENRLVCIDKAKAMLRDSFQPGAATIRCVKRDVL